MPRSNRAKQTRLEFTPLPSSSPAAKGYPKQIQERAAAVGYLGSSGSPAKKHKVQKDGLGSAQLDGANEDLPTPAATMSLNTVRNLSDEDDEPIGLSGRQEGHDSGDSRRLTTRSRRARQKQLDFSRSRNADSFDAPVRLTSSPKISSSRAGLFGSKGSRIRKRNNIVVEISSEEEGSGNEVSFASEAQNGVGAVQLDGPADESDDEDEGPVSHIRSSQRPAIVESDEEDMIVAPDREEDMPTTQGKLPRRKQGQNHQKDDFISSSPPRAMVSDDDMEIIEPPKGNRKRRRLQSDNEDGEEEVETPKTPGRRLLKRPRKLTQREQEDLNDDLDFLGPSSDVEALERQPRSTQDKAKDARKAALDRLKRQRAGQPQLVEEQDEEEAEAENSQLAANEDSDDASSSVYEITAQPRSSREMFAADEYDDDFLESAGEDDVTLGVQDGVPIEFTKYASMKPKELFVYAVEWMVQKKINPAFNMNDDLYNLTFRKLDDEVQGLAGSKFKSAAWTPQFMTALKNRPEIAYEYIDNPLERPDRCDACNRTKHPATFQVQFQGKTYNPHTLEEVGNDADDDDDDDNDSSSEHTDDDQPVYDWQGNKVAPANTIFNIGRFCMANAETAHNLQHWRFHLNELAIFWLEMKGYMTQEAVVKRDRKSSKKRKKEANRITDRMEREGEIRSMWSMYRKGIDEARSSKQGRFGNGDDE
ncbi:hypothetical protein LTR62_000219 [Meristemomyces frigidus]|uniref:DUF4211 domain-containing protein n=1 Tax=Meristemomyces frigidus TaxID=1508187 RepID=A0AAN7YSZ0_9PEZI|nr:hypothetical protein LTR62_000219 [Meristemomyces frigidus]